MQAKHFPMEGEMERKGKYLESETLFFLPFQPLLSMFPYAHKCTIWVSIQIGFSIFHLLNQENRHVRNVLYSVYLVSFREVYPSEKKKNHHFPAIREHSSYRHDFLLCTIGPPEQIFNSVGYTVTYSELVSVCSNWYFLSFVFYSWFYFYWYCFSRTRLLNTATLILKWVLQDLKEAFYCTLEETFIFDSR